MNHMAQRSQASCIFLLSCKSVIVKPKPLYSVTPVLFLLWLHWTFLQILLKIKS